MWLVFPAVPAEFLHLQALGRGFLVLRPGIVPVLALGALKGDDVARHSCAPTL
jgi:hypothetical protein